MESGVDPPPWIEALKPNGKVQRKPLLPSSDFEVWHVPVIFQDWVRPKEVPPLSWHETYGKTQITVDGRSRSIAEIEIARRLSSQGYEAYLLDAFGAMPVADDWKKWTITMDEMPQWLRQLCRQIRRRTGNTKGRETTSIPDVVAWRTDEEEPLFVEYKGLKDKPRPTQEEWMRVALLENYVPEESIVVVERIKR